MEAHPDTIRIGTSVRVRDADGEIETYVITSAKDADPRAGKVSSESPLGGALLGRRQGESVVIRAPRASYTVTIESIE
jgi:transcription elongation factor GreA